MGMKTSEQIRVAAALLTEDNWHQGAYFMAKSGTVCMCAHGALQYVVNPTVSKALEGSCEATKVAAWAAGAAGAAASAVAAAVATSAAEAAARGTAVAEAADAGAAAAGVGALAAASVTTPEEVFRSKPPWAHPAHYIMGMVGLTTLWNDARGRTLSEVKAKFEEAARLCELLEKEGVAQ